MKGQDFSEGLWWLGFWLFASVCVMNIDSFIVLFDWFQRLPK